MKILYTISSFKPATTGPANAIYSIAKELKKKHDIYVITTDFGSEKITTGKWIKYEEINVYYLKMLSNKTTLFNAIWGISLTYLKNFFLIKKLIKKINPEIIHINSIFNFLSFISGYLSFKYKIKYIITSHCDFATEQFNIRKFRKKFFLRLPFLKKILKNAFFHVTSEKEKLELIKNINKELNIELKEKNIYKRALPADESSYNYKWIRKKPSSFKTILYLGRISVIKNIEALIEAFASLKKGEFKLIIAGNTNENSKYTLELKNIVKNYNLQKHITFTDKAIYDEEKFTLLKNADVFILPSLVENFGITVLESLAQGTPVIASKGSPWQELEIYNAGYWTENTPEALKLCINNFFKLNIDERKIMSENAVKLAEKYKPQYIIPAYDDMYKTILKENKK